MTRERAALAALLLLTALAYTVNLSESGYANSFYAAAVQAGTKSWKAFLFGSIDSSSFITVDKPPASLWVMAISGRIFGFSSWSMLVPQALEGVAAVALLCAAVKRWFGSGAGLAAGLVFAATPVAALMFRFNNPDALLVLLLLASAYCLTRAIEKAGTRWILACGALIGFAFLTKMLQAFLVLPAFSLVYLVAAPTGLRRRVAQLLAGGGALLVAAGWWVALVALWPAGSRPLIDGSADNSIFNLITGYNGLSRIFGSGGGGGAGGGGGGGANFSGSTGLFRLFNSLMGGQASWLLPAALLVLVVGLVARRGRPRTDRARAALLLWGGWLIVTAVVFSFGQGTIHTYYTVALAPAIAALIGIGGGLLWPHRASLPGRLLLAGAVAGSTGWAVVLLDQTPSWEPWLQPLIIVLGAVAVLGLLLSPLVARSRRRLLGVSLACSAAACLAGPLAYAAETISTAHTGSIPTAGPASAGGPGGVGGGVRGGGFPGGASAKTGSGPTGGTGAPGGGGAPSRGDAPSGSGAPSVASSLFGSSSSGRSTGTRSAASAGSSAAGGQGGSVGPGGASNVSAALVKALEQNAGRYRWAAATSGSQSAASLELASNGDPVMAIGGFSGTGGQLSLAAFQRYVAAGDIHYYIVGSGGGGAGGGPGGSGSTSTITAWVRAHYKAETIGGETVYDLTAAKSG